MNINELPTGLIAGLLVAVISIAVIKIKKHISDKIGEDIDCKKIDIKSDNRH
ncbi:hypothetical protein [Endozoicomonas sp. ONNA1]|uniref:hypothetical protein n=1 Tax=Endozoicomonas sp. ONNA1 TaxID=2828740 RepID=UPI0021476DC6|nr:hypothetical protein [Endozoicomonas sp. ONNA1]